MTSERRIQQIEDRYYRTLERLNVFCMVVTAIALGLPAHFYGSELFGSKSEFAGPAAIQIFLFFYMHAMTIKPSKSADDLAFMGDSRSSCFVFAFTFGAMPAAAMLIAHWWPL